MVLCDTIPGFSRVSYGSMWYLLLRVFDGLQIFHGAFYGNLWEKDNLIDFVYMYIYMYLIFCLIFRSLKKIVIFFKKII